MTEKWKAAFKQIYGTTPTKSDYKMAPDHIKEVYYGQSPASPPTPKKSKCLANRSNGVRLKRPADDQYSPLKRPQWKKSRTETSMIYFRSPRKQFPMIGASLDAHDSSSKKQMPCSPLKALQPVDIPVQTSPPRIVEIEASNKQTMDSFLPQASVVDTPDKGRFLCESSPFKMSDVNATPNTPIRSPRKPVTKDITMRNVSTLLLPTPEKPKGEPMEPFKSEECNSPKRGKASKKSVEGMASAFSVETGRTIKRSFKCTISSDQKSSNAKKQDGNFVRINMKKKSFVRGKLSAEQKRKIRRKQNWKKRFGSKTK